MYEPPALEGARCNGTEGKLGRRLVGGRRRLNAEGVDVIQGGWAGPGAGRRHQLAAGQCVLAAQPCFLGRRRGGQTETTAVQPFRSPPLCFMQGIPLGDSIAFA